MNQDLFINSYLEKINRRFEFEAKKGHAFEIFSIAAILDKPFDEVYNDISTLVKSADGLHGGKHDGGIDGIYFDDDSDTLAVFQAKDSEFIGENEVGKFITDYENLFVHLNRSRQPLNAKIQAQLESIWDKPKQGITYTPKLFFVFNGKKNAQNKDIAERYQNANPILSIVDSDELYLKIQNLRLIQNKRKPVDFTFNVEKSNIATSNDPQAIVTYAKGNVRSVSFRLKATELCSLIEKEKSINGSDDHLYGQNVRGFLGKVRTNEKIRETLMGSNPEYFPFLNNGITMIAEKLKLPSSMQAGFYPIQTTNPVIVNGLQSTRVIYDVFLNYPKKIQDVDVMVRLYDANDDDLAEQITTATNTQTTINVTDKMSNRDFNNHAKTLFENKGIGYLSKRGDSFQNKFSRDLDKTITSETLLKFWFAMYLEKPEIAKSSKATVLQQIYDATTDSSHQLRAFFSGDLNSPIYQQLLNVYYIHYYVVEMRTKHSAGKPDLIQHADEILCYGLFKYLKLDSGINEVDASKFKDAYDFTFSNLEKITETEKVRLQDAGHTYSHNTYFKKPKSHIDLNNIAGWTESKFSESIINS